MDPERTIPSGETTAGEPEHSVEGHIVGSGLVMPQEDDPAGEGHMFRPSAAWSPARPDAPSHAGDKARSSSPRSVNPSGRRRFGAA